MVTPKGDLTNNGHKANQFADNDSFVCSLRLPFFTDIESVVDLQVALVVIVHKLTSS